ncbi:MAG: hypothetical protein Q9227_003252 [Pyrenula ochraceoflavens]
MSNYIEQFGSQSATVHGIIVSSILLSASVSSFLAGRPADVLGRPRAIALGSIIFALGSALQAGAATLAMFIVGRVVAGVGQGLFFGTLTVYICEISPPSVRGTLTALPQFMITLGLVVGYFTAYGTNRVRGSLSWRLPFALLAAYDAAYAAACLLILPPSPRWLIIKGRYIEANATYDRLGIDADGRQKIEEVIGEEMSEEETLTENGEKSAAESPSSTNRITPREREATSFLDVFSSDVRGRTTLAVFLMAMLQLSGIDGVLYYAPLLFQQAGLTSSSASFFASGISGLLIFLFSIPALLFADRWGRRTCTIIGGLILTVTMLLIGSLYAGEVVHSHGAARWVVIVSIYIYSVGFSTTWAVSIKCYVPEIQPQRTRAQTTSLAHGANWVTNFLVAFTCPILLANSSSAAYFLFGGCTAVTTVVCFLFMVETRRKSLEEVEEAFKAKNPREKGRIVAKVTGVFRKAT